MSAEWKKRKEAGNTFVIGLMAAIARHGNRHFARLFLLPISLYFVLMRKLERQASRDFLQRVLKRPVTLMDSARHIHCFASTVLDRAYLLTGALNQFDTQISGLPDLHAALDQNRGVLLFGSHLGSFEVLRVLAQERPDYVIRVVLDKLQNPMVTEALDKMNPDIASKVIDASMDGPSVVLSIKDALEQGELVALLIDRIHADEAHEHVEFLGAPAPFPLSPWLIASVLRVPVVLGFGLYQGGNRYALHFEMFSEQIVIPRQQRQQALRALVQQYADRLACFVRKAPYNWFNFYDFWQTNEATSQTLHPQSVDTGNDECADRNQRSRSSR